MGQSPSWEENRPSAKDEIPRILWNHKVNYPIKYSLPLVFILRQNNPLSYFP